MKCRTTRISHINTLPQNRDWSVSLNTWPFSGGEGKVFVDNSSAEAVILIETIEQSKDSQATQGENDNAVHSSNTFKEHENINIAGSYKIFLGRGQLNSIIAHKK